MFKSFIITSLCIVALFISGCTARCPGYCGPKVARTITLEGVHFDFNKYELRPEGKAILDKDIEELKTAASMNISIEGHCDVLGTDEYNNVLSKSRAGIVFSYLMSKGVSPDRMKTTGFGRMRPVATNDTEAGRAKNRRVELVITKGK